MDLNFKKLGEGPDFIILHGLYGSSDNWFTMAKSLADHFTVYLLDLRNHGESAHHPEHNYELMSQDVAEFCKKQNISKATMLGHSMGGKTAMFFAAKFREMVSSLIVVDISPKSYKNTDDFGFHTVNHAKIIDALLQIDLKVAESRKDIDQQLAKTISDKRVRQFLLKNVTRDNEKNFIWMLNLSGLKNNLERIMEGLPASEFKDGIGISGFPVLFLKGENSNYITNEDHTIIRQYFPKAKIVTIPEAGHWLHAEKPALFKQQLFDFLNI